MISAVSRGPLEVRRHDGVDHAEVAGGVARLVAPEVGERRVGLTLPTTVSVPLGLPVADQQHAGHGARTYRPRRLAHAAAEMGSAGAPSLRSLAHETEEVGVDGRAAPVRGGPRGRRHRSRRPSPAPPSRAVLEAAAARYGEAFGALVPSCAVWRNGEPCDPADAVTDDDEVAVLPPVSGGSA